MGPYPSHSFPTPVSRPPKSPEVSPGHWEEYEGRSGWSTKPHPSEVLLPDRTLLDRRGALHKSPGRATGRGIWKRKLYDH